MLCRLKSDENNGDELDELPELNIETSDFADTDKQPINVSDDVGAEFLDDNTEADVPDLDGYMDATISGEVQLLARHLNRTGSTGRKLFDHTRTVKPQSHRG